MRRLSGKWIFAAAFVAGMCVGWLVRFPPTDSASAAGWAQALGAVAAIVGSVMVTRAQMRHAVEREEIARSRDQRDRLNGIIAVASKLHIASGRTQKVVRQRIAKQMDYREAIHGYVALSNGGRKALDAVPLHEPPYAQIAREVIVMHRAIYLYERRISKLLDASADVEMNVHKAQLIVDRMSKEMQRLRARVERVLACDFLPEVD